MFKIAQILLVLALVFVTITDKTEAETILTFEDILQQSIENSYDLKISDVDIRLSEVGLKEAKSDYYPTIKLGYNNEYSRNLSDKVTNFASVGSTFVNPNTRFQNLFSVNLTYNMFDFGIRNKRALIARKDIIQKEIQYFQRMRDLKLDVADIYTDALISYKEIKAQEQIQDLYKLLFEAKVRLYEAGERSKLDIMDEAVNIATARYKIDKTTHRLESSLKDLSIYTFEDYELDDVVLKNYEAYKEFETYDDDNEYAAVHQKVEEEISMIPDFKPDVIIEKKIYDIEIEKKQEELKLAKKERLPKFEFYSSYLFYGADNDNPIKSVTNIRNKNVSVGVSALLPVFDGFKNAAKQEKIRLEIERLELEKGKKTHEITKKYEKLKQEALAYQKEFVSSEALLLEYKNQLNAIERLTENQLMEKTEVLTKKADLISQILDLEINLIKANATFKKLKFWAEGPQ